MRYSTAQHGYTNPARTEKGGKRKESEMGAREGGRKKEMRRRGGVGYLGYAESLVPVCAAAPS